MEYIIIIISAVLVNNIVLAQFLGICPFLGVSQKVSTAIGMSAAVMFVMTLATIVTFVIHKAILMENALLVALDLTYLRTIFFILIIASLVQIVEIVMKKVSPPLYQALGVFLPLITTNCAILGVAILVIQKDYNLAEGIVFGIANAIGFALALVVFAGIRERLDLQEVPEVMKGAPVALVTAGLLALAFMGFVGIV